MQRITVEEWVEHYNAILDGDELKTIDACGANKEEMIDFAKSFSEDNWEKHVWTLVEEDDNEYILPGLHLVNRLNWYFTEKPWETLELEVLS